MNHFRRGYTRIILGTCFALLLIALGIEYFQYQRNQHLILTDLKNRLVEHTSNVNLRARTIQGYVNGLKMTAENTLYYVKEKEEVSPLFFYLKDFPSMHSYGLDLEDSPTNKKMVGNLIGFGTLETLSKPLINELNMALLLNIPFGVTLRNNRGAVWVYYTSQHHFQNLYPWVPEPPGPYKMSSESKNLFEQARPEANPKGLNFWTRAHKEGPVQGKAYQKDVVITNASPIYDGDDFLGVVSLDLSLTELRRVMNRFSPLEGALLLLNEDLQVLAARGLDLALFKEEKVPHLTEAVSSEIASLIKRDMKVLPQWFTFQGDTLIYVMDLHEAPWFMVYVGSKTHLLKQALIQALEDIALMTLILLFVVGLGYWIVIRDFILPAQKLVDHISKENKGIESHPKNIPSQWKVCFDIISHIFADHRALFSDLEGRVERRTKQLQKKNQDLKKTLMDLKKAQNQIIVQEKLASLGALTAGIAHEIKNPLHFIINFSELSLEYVHELKEKIPDEKELFELIEKNIEKARHHAEQADSIVKSMLEHARGSSGEITTFPLNPFLEETIDLAYIGFQGKETHFKAQIIKKFDKKVFTVQGAKQDLGRVFLNIANNAFFAMHEKQEKLGKTYTPILTVITHNKEKSIQIIFEDNGPGIPESGLKSIFHPFFTTKDTGKGTGLGLSLSYDIITQQHHGHLRVESQEDRATRFIIDLPKHQEIGYE